MVIVNGYFFRTFYTHIPFLVYKLAIMNWNTLADINQLADIDALSIDKPILVFKHSTRCSISATALSRLERNWKAEDADKVTPYYLDLLQHRDISNAIADKYGVEHESPQALVIKDGKVVYHESHMGISYNDIVHI